MNSRGQTNLDFAIGVSIFLLTISFAFLFIPTVFAPFEIAQGQPVTADRVSIRLVDTMLAGQNSGTIAPACTLAFFAAVDTPGCPYDANQTLSNSLGVGDRSIRVAVVQNGNVVELDGTIRATDGSTQPATQPYPLERGAAKDAVPEDAATVARAVSLDGEQVRVVVSVW